MGWSFPKDVPIPSAMMVAHWTDSDIINDMPDEQR